MNIMAIGCTISGNTADGIGGGIAHMGDPIGRAGVISLVNSTVSGNRSKQHGGGVYIDGQPDSTHTISDSTIAFNVSDDDYVLSPGGSGGGLFVRRGVVEIDHSIIAGNVDHTTVGPDVTGFLGARLIVKNSLIGTNSGSDLAQANVGSPDANGNLIGGGRFAQINPRLGQLTDNGGPTMTHALLPGGPAINAGNPAAKAGVGGVPLYDQRGEPFTRVYGGRIDIGAFEAQPNPLTGDYNFSGVVDAADMVAWRKTLGFTTNQRADGNGDGVVNQDDWQVWRGNFGRTAESMEQGARSGEPESSHARPHRLAWQPPASPGVSLATPRPAFRPATYRLAPVDELLASLALPRATSVDRNDFAAVRRQVLRHDMSDAAELSASAIDRVFETVGARVAGRL